MFRMGRVVRISNACVCAMHSYCC